MADKNYGLATVVAEQDSCTTQQAPKTSDTGDPAAFEVDLMCHLFSSCTQADLPKRYINSVAIVNFGFCSQCGWQPMGYILPLIMLNGGPSAFVWGLVFATIGSLGVAASLAEMASMDPHVGAQYRWSASFARRHGEFWGLLQGWITVFAWIVNVAPVLSMLAQTVQGLIQFYSDSYVAERWHTTLLMIAFLAASILCNLYLRRILAILETLGGICHVLFFVVTIVILTTMARRSTPSFVFKTLISDVSGWNNPGISWNLGVTPLIIGLVNCDGVTHMT